MKGLILWNIPGRDRDAGRRQNRRQKVFNRGLRSSAGGLCVCFGGPDIIKLSKTPLTYSVSRFNLGGLKFCLGGLIPPNPPRGDGTGRRDWSSVWQRLRAAAQPAQIFLEAEYVDIQRATVFFSGQCLSKDKMTRYARNLEGAMAPLARPVVNLGHQGSEVFSESGPNF